MMRRYLPGAIITAGAVLRCWNLMTSQVWYDESFTLLVSRLPLPQLLQATAGDVHPPAYYLLIAALLRLVPWAPAAWLLRGSSVVLGILVLVLFWRLTGLMGLGKSARIAALAFLAFLPVEVFYSQEGRMYVLLQLLIMGQVWAIWSRKWVMLGLLTAAALYTHNYALVYSAVIFAAGLLHELSLPRPVYRAHIDGELTPGMLRLFLAMAAAGLAWLPWAAVLAGQLRQVGASYWIQPVTLGGLTVALSWIVTGFLVPDIWVIPALLALGAVLLLVLRSGLQHKRVFLLLWLFAPLGTVAAISWLWKPILLYRGFYPGLPALAMLGGESWAAARSGAPRLGRWLLLVPWVVVLGWQVGAAYNGQLKGWSIWPSQPTAGIIVHLEDTSYILLRQNWPGVQHYFLDAGCPPEPGALTKQTRSALGYRYITLEQLSRLQGWQLAAALGPLATQCHESIYNRLTGAGRPVYLEKSPFSSYGIWRIDG